MFNEEFGIMLASASPRRRSLLSELIHSFEVCSTDIDESVTLTDPEEIVKAISYKKAVSVNYKGIVIASDTLVFDGKKPLGKPKDRTDAYNMLKELSGKIHQVYTGVCIRQGDSIVLFADRTDVEFKTLSDEDIYFYIDNYNPLDKAGAYGIQDEFCVKNINGSYSNVMGLPLEMLRERLIDNGINVKE